MNTHIIANILQMAIKKNLQVLLFNKPKTLSQNNPKIIQPLVTSYHCSLQKPKRLLLMNTWGWQLSAYRVCCTAAQVGITSP